MKYIIAAIDTHYAAKAEKLKRLVLPELRRSMTPSLVITKSTELRRLVPFLEFPPSAKSAYTSSSFSSAPLALVTMEVKLRRSAPVAEVRSIAKTLAAPVIIAWVTNLMTALQCILSFGVHLSPKPIAKVRSSAVSTVA